MNGQTIVDSHDKGIALEGPSSGRSQSFEKYQDKDRPLDTADFEVRVDEEKKEVFVLACPEKQVPLDHVRSEKSGKTLVHFDASMCKECKVNTRCPVKIGVVVATFSLQPIYLNRAFQNFLEHHGITVSPYAKQTTTMVFCAFACGGRNKHGDVPPVEKRMGAFQERGKSLC